MLRRAPSAAAGGFRRRWEVSRLADEPSQVDAGAAGAGSGEQWAAADCGLLPPLQAVGRRTDGGLCMAGWPTCSHGPTMGWPRSGLLGLSRVAGSR